MTSEAQREEPCSWIGPGRRMDDLASLLSAIAGDSHPFRRGRSDELEIPSRPGLLALDADELGPDDVLDLRRWLASSSAARALLIGEDSTRRGVRALLRLERVRWMSWPPDVEDLRSIVLEAAAGALEAAAGSTIREGERASGAPSVRSLPTEPASRVSDAPAMPAESGSSAGDRSIATSRRARSPLPSPIEADLLEIERVLGSGGVSLEQKPGDELPAELEISPPPRVEREPPLATEPSSRAVAEARAEPIGGSAPAPAASDESFRAQVADLADIAQRIELSLLALRETQESGTATPDAGAALESLSGEVVRLVQFARTLGYVVSPPGPGSQTFDLAEMLELFLTEIRAAGPDAPRCLLRSNGALRIRSDRQLLSQAFDALFFLARSAAGKGEIVRVQARRDEEASPPSATVSIDFPAGILRDVAPPAMLRPYGLKSLFPNLGPNALSAAVRIVEGQGGRCALEPQARGRLEWRLSLPLAPGAGEERAASRAAAIDGARPAGARAEDPFA
jgi:hypothetical protein